MDWIQALVLGIVQGLTVFIPISWTAHLRIIPYLLDCKDTGTEFSAVIQLGTLIAVIIYFWNDVVTLSRAAIVSLWHRKLFETSDSKLAWSIAAGTIPIAVIGLGFKDIIKTDARELWLVGTALIILAIGLYAAENLSKQNIQIDQLNFLKIQFFLNLLFRLGFLVTTLRTSGLSHGPIGTYPPDLRIIPWASL